MHKQSRILTTGMLPALLTLALCAGVARGQSRQAQPGAANLTPVQSTPELDAETQRQLLKLLRLSPTLTMVVARDPSLLSDQPYVARNSPELAQFLQAHPEVARNPDFYLFSNLPKYRGEHGGDALERKIWPDLAPAPDQSWATQRILDDIAPFAVFLCVVGSLLWLIRMLMENRRWNRIFKLQTEVHSRLIERFGSNQELLTYMDTEAGKRFLEAAPIPVDFGGEQQRIPNAVARVLMPLQIGVVLTLLGIGLLSLRWSLTELAEPLLVCGVIVLMPGLGFIISAGITWFLAGRLGLMPQKPGGTQLDVRER